VHNGSVPEVVGKKTAGLRAETRSVVTEGLVLVARAGFFPNGNDRSLRNPALLLAAHRVGAGAAKVMREGRGHF
jgi:hypothetical protein